MQVAVTYCNQKALKALEKNKSNAAVYAAFSALEQEIKTLSRIQQIRLYSATTCFLESLIEQPQNIVNPLDVFICQCDSVMGSNHTAFGAIVMGLGVLAISLSVAACALSAGIGIGILAGLWQSAAMFYSALSIAATAPVVVAASSSALGLGAGALSSYFFFKEPKINKAIKECVNAVKLCDVPSDDEEPVILSGLEAA